MQQEQVPTLKSQLKTIITNGHIDNGYSGLWAGYQTTDRDNIAISGYETTIPV